MMQLTDREPIPFTTHQKFSIGISSDLGSAREEYQTFSNVVNADNDEAILKHQPPRLNKNKKKQIASSRMGPNMKQEGVHLFKLTQLT